MIYYVIVRGTKEVLDTFDTREEAEAFLAAAEEEDKKDGFYVRNFYAITDSEHLDYDF